VRLRLALLFALILCAQAATAVAAQPIDDYRYDRAKDCRKHPTPGALALVNWLEKNAKGTFWGIMRCERWGKNSASLHAEGRAVDWHLDSRVPADRREARRLIDLWLAPDADGNEHALARRMGIQEIIWNCHSRPIRTTSTSGSTGRARARRHRSGDRRVRPLNLGAWPVPFVIRLSSMHRSAMCGRS
jgi:hypothetical protein